MANFILKNLITTMNLVIHFIKLPSYLSTAKDLQLFYVYLLVRPHPTGYSMFFQPYYLNYHYEKMIGIGMTIQPLEIQDSLFRSHCFV